MTTMLSLNGIGFQYLWPDSVWWGNISAPFFIFLDTVALPQFSRSFLDMKKGSPVYDKILLSIIIMGACGMVSAFLVDYSIAIRLATLLAFLAVTFSFIGGFVCLVRGYRAARYYMVAWTLLLIGAGAFALQNAGLLPFNFFTRYGHQIGSAAEVILLSMALADRINILKQEKARAQEDMILMQKTYSDSLERTVQERTLELEVEKNKLKAINESMEQEILLASRIQESLIPSESPTENICSLYRPMKMVGGDFYDFLKFRDPNKVGIFLSDVSGHGVPAAFITSMVKTIILQAGERKKNPSKLLLYLNEILMDQTAGNFITAFYGIFDRRDRTFLFSSAGHCPPFLIHGGNIEQIKGHKGIAIAIVDNNVLHERGKEYKNSKITLPLNSKLLLYTDGLVETRPFNDGGRYFEDDDMMAILRESENLRCGAFIDNLYSRLIQFRGGDSFEDDVCLICLDVQ
jgi:serine phosphatase RsbU (regulator of sigma subunit)